MTGRGNALRTVFAIAMLVVSYTVTAGAVNGDAPRAPADFLSRADQQYIQREFADAMDLYMVGRYYQARLKIVGIYSMVPSYKDSEDLLRLIDAALAKKK